MGVRTHQDLNMRRSAIAAIAVFLAAISLMIVGATRAQQRPRQTGTATPSPTATPVPQQTGPTRRIAPQLGAPPPAPILKPKPTPTPDPTSRDRRKLTNND